MIKSWNKFFESNEGEFTEEMAQEILYTFGEDSKGYSSDDPEIKDFLRSGAIWQGITFYETDYSEMKEFTKTLMKNAERNPEVKAECIRVYNYIRKQNEIFPEIFQIEDYYLSLIEKYGFDFYVDIDMGSNYKIRLRLWERDKSLQDFITMCQEVEKSMKKVESSRYYTRLTKCDYSVYYIDFSVELKKNLTD
jgi:hypothetical protein